MKQSEIVKLLKFKELRIDTRRQSFEMSEIDNRRFMFNPQTGTLLLGKYHPGNKIVSSHAVEHGCIGRGEPYDDFIRGWIGVGSKYKNGVIHFAPPITKDSVEMFNKGFSALEMFMRNGAKPNTVIRGFPGAWEQPLSNMIKCKKPPTTLMKRLEQKKEEAKNQAAQSKKKKIQQERG